jgi:hypothetical protein
MDDISTCSLSQGRSKVFTVAQQQFLSSIIVRNPLVAPPAVPTEQIKVVKKRY